MGKADNMFKLYVQIGGGAYFCHRCGGKGSWYDFKMKLGGFEVTDSMGNSSHGSHGSHGHGGGQKPNSQEQGSMARRGQNQNRNNSQSQQQSDQQGGSSGKGYGKNNTHEHGGNANIQPLPMPSPRLQAAYITNLLDTPPTDNANSSSQSLSPAMQYLTQERGLTKQTLRKYGVGLGSYNFPSNEIGQHGKYVRADCVTFPWIMRAKDVNEQEVLRGCEYSWDSDSKDVSNTKNAESSGVDNDLENSNGSNNIEKKEEDATGDTSEEEYEQEESHLGPFVTRRIKARAVHQKSWQRLDPPGGGWGLFGWHTVPSSAKEIVLTEGEYDAMAVYQATGRPAVSLPNGCRSLPVEVLPMLERFDRVYLWMDNDGPGREGAEQFAKKIGVNRCLLVQPDSSVMDLNGNRAAPPKDANEALLQGMDLEKMILDADVLPHERILTFAELRTQVIHEMLNPEKYTGVPVPSLPGFTGIIKGFRRGEMTVLTGPTGSGKTTFLGQLSLDFAEGGVNTLWGSFEIKNTRLMHKLLQQYSRGPMPEDKMKKAQALEVLADRFETLPLYFMKFHGGSDIDDVLDAMEYAAYVHDVQHIILDNMQFMISRNSSKFNSSFDKYEIQDIAIEKFRKFATSKNVHVTLVVHPRKEDEGVKLGMSSVYGSAKATQEADNVLILQKDANNENRKFVEVKKNRYDGTLGICPLHFNFDSKRYSETPVAQLSSQKKVARPAAVPPRVIPMTAGGRTFVSAASTKTKVGPAAPSTKPASTNMDLTYSSILED